MKAYQPLKEAFKKLGETTSAWHKFSKFPKSAETANVILGNRCSVVDASTLAYLAHCLDIPNKDIVSLLDVYASEVPRKASEVAVLKKLISPVELTGTEQTIITQFREMSANKRGLMLDMATGLLTRIDPDKKKLIMSLVDGL